MDRTGLIFGIAVLMLTVSTVIVAIPQFSDYSNFGGEYENGNIEDGASIQQQIQNNPLNGLKLLFIPTTSNIIVDLLLWGTRIALTYVLVTSIGDISPF